MRFEVPQFIEIEDKIFGPFTWRQFVYLLGGAGALFMLFVLLPFFLFILIGGPLAALTASLAFYQVNNRPFIHTLESLVLYLLSKRLYLWKKSPIKVQKTAVAGPPQTYLPPSKSNLASMSRKLEINAMQKK